MSRLRSRTAAARAGFTLIEVVVALTVMALVITTLYVGFSTALSVWSKQEGRGREARREALTMRLFGMDMLKAAPYTQRWQQGTTHVFQGGPRTLFYVTRNGFGASDRGPGGLYFSCFFLLPAAQAGNLPPGLKEEEATGETLQLVKVGYPAEWFMGEASAFATMSQESRAQYTPGEEFLDHAVFLLGGLTDASLSYDGEEELTLELARTLTEDLASEEGGLEPPALPEDFWSMEELPTRILLSYVRDGKRRQSLVSPLPYLPLEEKP